MQSLSNHISSAGIFHSVLRLDWNKLIQNVQNNHTVWGKGKYKGKMTP